MNRYKAHMASYRFVGIVTVERDSHESCEEMLSFDLNESPFAQSPLPPGGRTVYCV